MLNIYWGHDSFPSLCTDYICIALDWDSIIMVFYSNITLDYVTHYIWVESVLKEREEGAWNLIEKFPCCMCYKWKWKQVVCNHMVCVYLHTRKVMTKVHHVTSYVYVHTYYNLTNFDRLCFFICINVCNKGKFLSV